MIQRQDTADRGDGTGGESVYGPTFPDENLMPNCRAALQGYREESNIFWQEGYVG